MRRRHRRAECLLDTITAVGEGRAPYETEAAALEAWAELVAYCDDLLAQHEAGEVEQSVETVLARCVLAEDAALRHGRVEPPQPLLRCLWCGTSGLTHDPACPNT